MTGLEVKIAGIPTRTADKMIKCIEFGGGGVVAKTVTYNPMHQIQPRPRFAMNWLRGRN